MTYYSDMVFRNVSREPATTESYDLKIQRIQRLIEGLQHLAGLIYASGEAISEHDRILLANLLNNGASPFEAAGEVARARISLH